ncbi:MULTISPECIES: hypothetical protein [Streptomyces]|nr:MULTISPECIES: hypothetical protein [Streptomyces]MCZ4102165.1 hypothetical protein [Streptomyces sp. H39-C1]
MRKLAAAVTAIAALAALTVLTATTADADAINMNGAPAPVDAIAA